MVIPRSFWVSEIVFAVMNCVGRLMMASLSKEAALRSV